MTMQTISRLFGLALVALTLATGAQAQDNNATVFIVHGTDGRDLGLAKKLPVDASVDGACALTDFRFGEVTDGISLPAGSYDIEVYLSDGACGGASVLAGTFKFKKSERATIVVHLDAEGNLTASKFDNRSDDLVRDGAARIVVRHTAWAPVVDVPLSRNKNLNGGIALSNLANGEQRTVVISSKKWNAWITPYLADALVAGPVPIKIPTGTALYVQAVGSLTNDTFTLITFTEPLGEH